LTRLIGVEIVGGIFAILGLAAWTGHYRGWTRLIFGSFVFMCLPVGIGFELIALGTATGVRIIGLIGIGLILLLGMPLAFLAPELIGPAWYPRSKIRIGRNQRPPAGR
jgi:hypothetical protein